MSKITKDFLNFFKNFSSPSFVSPFLDKKTDLVSPIVLSDHIDSTKTVERKIELERRRRHQAYTALDYHLSLTTYFDFFSFDTFQIAKDAKYLTQIEKGKNEFSFILPHSNTNITFKLLTGHDDSNIDKEIEGLKKIQPNASPELTTRLKYMITSVNGNRESKDIRQFVDNYLLARDSRALREYIRQIQPDVDLTFTTNDGEEAIIPINLNFFWPDI
jgi:hypothetical protein